MAHLNLTAAWAGVLAGVLAGAILGLYFHHEDWLGGYDSWPRRLLRLGHVSFFGLAFLNFAFVFTAERMGWSGGPHSPVALASVLLVAGAALMPAVCAVAAFRPGTKMLFAAPVACVAAAAGIVASTLAMAGAA